MQWMRKLVLTLAIVAAASFAAAQEAASRPSASRPAASQPTQEQMAQAAKMEIEIAQLFAAKQYEQAAQQVRAQLVLVPHAGGYYNLACAMARLNKPDEAVAALAACADMGYADFNHIAKDDDLESLRNLPQYKDVLAKVGENYNKALAARAKAQATQQQAARLAQEMAEAFAAKEHDKAIDLGRQIVELMPKDPMARYNLACGLSRLGKNDAAITELNTAMDLGYEDPAHLLGDDDLQPLREHNAWQGLMTRARENEKKAGGARYEAGAQIEGVKTVEGFPDGGLRYRLRMDPNATPEQPQRVIVWLHPSGGSANSVVEAMAPLFIKNGYALLVFTQKNFMGWSAQDAPRISRVMAEIDKIKGIQPRRPILMGFSAGGQMALTMWSQQPEKFSGLILDAAYPMEPAAGGYTPMPLPKGEAVRKTPVFVLVGDQDGGAATWKQAMPAWQKAGVPLTVHFIKGRKHEWLFGKEQQAELDQWLADVAAGKMPAMDAASKPAGE